MPKKRASRVGTRSVTSLTTVQLERKRANDREAQRAIRQRTKDHIDHLEQRICELRSWGASSEQLALATQYQNRELKEEVAFLRHEMNDAGLTPGHRPSLVAAVLVDQQDASSAALPVHRSELQCDMDMPSTSSSSSSSCSAAAHYDHVKPESTESAVIQDLHFPSDMTCPASSLIRPLGSEAGLIRPTYDSMNWRPSDRFIPHPSSISKSTKPLAPAPALQMTNIYQGQASTTYPRWENVHTDTRVCVPDTATSRPTRFDLRPPQAIPTSGPFCFSIPQETLTQSSGQVDTMAYDPMYMLYPPTLAVKVDESKPVNAHSIAQTTD